jgi:hypothetical protein
MFALPGLLRGGDQQKQAALFLIQLLREGGAYIAVEACRCSTLVNAIKLLMAAQGDLQQQEDASFLLLELSVFPSAAAELYACKIHLVASTLSWQQEVPAAVSWTAKTLCGLASANIDRRDTSVSRGHPPHLYTHLAALIESCLEAYWAKPPPPLPSAGATPYTLNPKPY